MKSGLKDQAACEGILIVEDDADLRNTLSTVLELEGISVRTAENGAKALEVLEREPFPCVILLDMMMPIMSGWDFLAKRRMSEELRKIPVVVCSAFVDEIPKDVVSVIKKPVDIDRLIRTVDTHVSKAA